MELVGAFLHFLESRIPPNEVGDKLWWRLKKNGDFDICSFYGVLRGSSSTTFPWRSIWGVKAPRQLCLDSHMGNNSHRGWLEENGCHNCDWCYLCRCSGENVTISCFIVRRFPSYGVLLLDRLALLGYPRGFWSIGRMEELLREALIKYLEFGTTMCCVDYLERV